MRILNIIKTDINSDKLKLEEELERIINDKTLETDKKIARIKNILKEIAITELSFNKFEDYLNGDKEDN